MSHIYKNERILTKQEVLLLTTQAARYCGFNRDDMILLQAIMELRIDSYLELRAEVEASENKPPPTNNEEVQ